MGSIIRKNSPTVAKAYGTGAQSQLNLDGLGNLLVSLAGGTVPTSFQDDNNNAALSTTLTDDSPGNGHGSQGSNLGALISAYNETNSSFRYIRQSNGNGLNVTGPVVRDPNANIQLASGSSATITNAIGNAINAIPASPTSIIEFVSVQTMADSPAYASFTCVIMYIVNF